MEHLGKQKNTVLMCTTARMKLENITLSEARHRVICRMIPLTRKLQNNQSIGT